jgi:hypothetical protein
MSGSGHPLAEGMRRRAEDDFVKPDHVVEAQMPEQRRLILPSLPVTCGRPVRAGADRGPEQFDGKG